MAHTTTNHIGQWNNFHFNGPFPTKILLDITTDRNIADLMDRYNDCAQEIQSLIRDSVRNNERFRAYGMGWSLSNVAHQRDRMLFNARLNIRMDIQEEHLHAATHFKSKNLFFFQCGNTIKEISEYIARRGKSLKTCGASNGQTIAGAISTGVHGSAIDVGSVQDYVVGLHLIIGPDAAHQVYLERHSWPALRDGFADRIQARVIRNDDLFNAALVSLGAFGVILGVVIEAEDQFLMKRYVKKVGREEALELAETMDFKNARFRIPGELELDGTGKRPSHYKLYINPYNAQEKFVAEIIYKKPYRTGYPDPIPKIKRAIYKDLPSWVASFAARHKQFIPAILQALASEAFPVVDDDIEGTLGEIFWDTTQQGKAFGCAFGIDHREAGRALDLMISAMKENGPIPGILSMRFVKASEATLAFTRFPVTCILEVDGLLWEANPQMISLEDFMTRMVEIFKDHAVKFTLHWGKNAPWSFPGLIDYMYGDADDTWKDIRSALLSKQMADLFSNDFLDTVKLSDYRGAASSDLIASIAVNATHGA